MKPFSPVSRQSRLDWRDPVALSVIELLSTFPERPTYSRTDVAALLDGNFKRAQLVIRLFLGLSDDAFEAALGALGEGGTGIKRYQRAPAQYIDALIDLGLLDAMAEEVNRVPRWVGVDAPVSVRILLVEIRLRALWNERLGDLLEATAKQASTLIEAGFQEIDCPQQIGVLALTSEWQVPQQRPQVHLEHG